MGKMASLRPMWWPHLAGNNAIRHKANIGTVNSKCVSSGQHISTMNEAIRDSPNDCHQQNGMRSSMTLNISFNIIHLKSDAAINPNNCAPNSFPIGGKRCNKCVNYLISFSVAWQAFAIHLSLSSLHTSGVEAYS